MRLCVTLCVLAATGGAGPADDDIGICKQGMAQLGGLELRPPAAEVRALEDTDVLHYVLDIEVVPGLNSLGGTNTISVRSLIDGLVTFQVRLHDTFTISAVEIGGTPVTWQRLSPTTIEVDLDQTYDTGEEFDLLIAYGGVPVSMGFGSINFSTQDGEPIVFTLSEPWFAYTWWPAKDDNDDKATGEMRITVPDPLTVASNGLLQAVTDVGGGRHRYDWLTGYQTATYLFSFSAALYNTFSGTYVHEGGSMPCDFFIFPSSDSPSNRNAWLTTVDMLPVMSDLFGPYPFIDEKYGIYQFLFGGGMEHQTMTGQGTFIEWISAHELGHSWFGNMMTCGTWQDIWLNEAFATYSEALWEEFRPGGSEEAMRAHMDFRRPSNVNGSVYVPPEDADNFSRIFSSNYSYRKGAWVVHQLRHVVGDQVFFDILAAYRAAYAYDSAITEEFRAVAESVYGDDLSWFFDEWIYDIGAPAYESAWRQHEIAGRRYVELYIGQFQSPSYPIFTMPLDVVVTTAARQATHVVWNDAEAEHLLFEVAGEVLSLELDPDDWTLHTANVSAVFPEGPPKVVLTAPEPGAAITWAEGTTIEITFHKDVSAGAGDFSLVGDATGPASFGFAYDGISRIATLTPDTELPPDDYTLTVGDGIVDLTAGLGLDGEVADPADPQALPSGDGLPGGDVVVRFRVDVLGDLDGDGHVSIGDFLILLSNWGPCPMPCPPSCAGDLNADCTVSIADLLIMLANWG
jgi:aminopeptidase N